MMFDRYPEPYKQFCMAAGESRYNDCTSDCYGQYQLCLYGESLYYANCTPFCLPGP